MTLDDATRRVRQELETALHHRRCRLYAEQIDNGMEVADADVWLRDQIILDGKSLALELPKIRQQILDACAVSPTVRRTGAGTAE